MCGIVGAASGRNIVPMLIDGVRRLEYRGYDSTGLAVINGTAQHPRLQRLVSTARVAHLAEQARSSQARRNHRHLAHAVGDARRTDADERASARVELRDRRRSQRHHRELRSAARPAEGRGLRIPDADRHRGDRASGPFALARAGRRRLAARRTGGDRRVSRRVRHRGHLDARSRAASSARASAARSSWASVNRITSSHPTPLRCCR